MPRDFFPRRETEILSFSQNFKDKIALDPQQYGLSDEQSAQYGAKHDAFALLLAAANSNSTRTPSIIFTKNESLAALEAEARKLARIVRANPNVTSEMRINLGLSVRDGGKGAPTHAPQAAPSLRITGVLGRTVKVRVADSQSPRRGKADGAAGAMIFACIGDKPAVNLGGWILKATTGRVRADVNFEASIAAGTKVWITACWFSPRFARGPSAPPLSAHLQDGVNLSTAIRLAA